MTLPGQKYIVSLRSFHNEMFVNFVSIIRPTYYQGVSLTGILREKKSC